MRDRLSVVKGSCRGITALRPAPVRADDTAVILRTRRASQAVRPGGGVMPRGFCALAAGLAPGTC